MARSSDLPPWLRGAGARSTGARPRRASRTITALGLAAVIFGGGAGAGFLFANRGTPVAVTAPAACPPAPVCPPERTGAAYGGTTAPHLVPAARRSKPAVAALKPLPERKPLDDGERTQALRAFAEKKGPELRDCLDEPDHGPPLKLGAALEIGANGSVDFVQIIGADNSSKDVRRCYASHLKRWRFPEELLRGEEKLLVNFVL